MPSAKVVSLKVRPFQVSHLCFEVAGILGENNTELGGQVTAFDFGLYGILGETFPGDDARLMYDFSNIRNYVKPFTLASLRAEPHRAALTKAINTRANSYYAKYANSPAIISLMNNSYSPSVAGSKPIRLETLANISIGQMNQLKAAYESDHLTGVLKTPTQSVLDSTLKSCGSSTAAGIRDVEGIGRSDYSDTAITVPAPTAAVPWIARTVGGPGAGPVSENQQMEANSDFSTSKGSATQHQTIVNTDYRYRIPYMENLAQYERAQISLMDEQFAQFMSGQNLPHLAAVFENELSSIDSDIYRMQVAYVNTILMSPIPGIVTGIYKNPGDAVRAGEPVIRVENNSDILLVATLIYRGPISIGSVVEVETKLFDSLALVPPLKGSVASVRGQQEDDHWEVIVKCSNLDSGSKPIFPIGYHFDYDDTKVSIM